MNPGAVNIVLSLFSALLLSFSDPKATKTAIKGKHHFGLQLRGQSYGLQLSQQIQEQLNWTDATEKCKELYGPTGRLANLDNKEFFTAVEIELGLRFPGEHLKLWVDGLYDEESKEFIWRETAIPVNQTWTPWGKREPQEPFTAKRRLVYYQITDSRAEFRTDDAEGLYGYLCQFLQ